MSDIYRPEDIMGLVLAFLVVMLIPVMIWSIWMAKKKPAPKPEAPRPPPIPEVGLGSLLMQYPNLKEIMVVARELELRIHRLSREAKMVADEQRYLTALSVLQEVTPECSEDGVRGFHEKCAMVDAGIRRVAG